MLKVPFPACGIFTVAKLVNLRPVQHLLNAATDARAGLWGLAPDRRQKLDDDWRVDGADVEFTESIAGSLERFLPLPLMLRVAVDYTLILGFSPEPRGGSFRRAPFC